MTTRLNITGMTCAHCVKAVESALHAVHGVSIVKVSLENGLAEVDGEATPERLILAVEEAGYGATVAA